MWIVANAISSANGDILCAGHFVCDDGEMRNGRDGTPLSSRDGGDLRDRQAGVGPLDGATGERMELPAYYADFQENYARTRSFWKLERGQSFAEPGDESWEAFDRGDWDEAMNLLDKRRPDLADYIRWHTENGVASRRIRKLCRRPAALGHARPD
jgi:hypothetical protein